MDHTKARAVAWALIHGGTDDLELVALSRAYLEVVGELAATHQMLDKQAGLRETNERLVVENERLRGALPEGFTLGESEYGFDVYESDEWVAGGTGPLESVRAEAAHYAMVYGQDGPTRVEFYKRTALRADEPVGDPEPAASLAAWGEHGQG